ncbi:MAG TPA: anthranilate phosphoribosyltransferase [Phycisphaerales bacterium]|nr:anthranilate phosphoribosyltransferase [Phycisphaerales bacterium]
MDIHPVLGGLVRGCTLTSDEAEALFERLLGGGLDDAQIAALLSLIQARGPTVDEVVGAARAMRRHVTPVPRPAGCEDAVLIDTCGTGGAPKTFNISTAAAIVAAACKPNPTRVLVAKHGNRSRSGRGSAELLGALGVGVDAAPEVQSRCLGGAGVCFCFAIHHHPAMKHAIGPRRSIGFPTIFNVLGPLTNPAGADRQLIGVYSEPLLPLVAEALARLGAVRAIVAHSADGLDELSTTAPTHLAHVEGGAVRRELLDARSLGLPRARIEDLQAVDVAHAAAIVRDVLGGRRGPHRDIVLLNSAAALLVAGAASDIASGLSCAAEAIDSGRAAETLGALARLSNRTDSAPD